MPVPMVNLGLSRYTFSGSTNFDLLPEFLHDLHLDHNDLSGTLFLHTFLKKISIVKLNENAFSGLADLQNLPESIDN